MFQSQITLPKLSCYEQSVIRLSCNMFSPLICSMKLFGLYPVPLCSTANNNRKLVGVFYSTILLILSWFNALRYFTLFFSLSDDDTVTEVTYYVLICLYYLMGATLRTVFFVGCLGNRWQKIVSSISLMRKKLADCDGGKALSIRLVLFVTIFSWLFLIFGELTLFLIIYYERSVFGLMASPLHFPNAIDDSKWGVAAFLSAVLGTISDSASIFGNVFICCLTLIHSDNFRRFGKILKRDAPPVDIDHIELFLAEDMTNVDFDSNRAITIDVIRGLAPQSSIMKKPIVDRDQRLSPPDSPKLERKFLLSSTSTSTPPNPQRFGSGFFDAESAREIHLCLVTIARQLDTQGRLGIFAAMASGFSGILILIHQITMGTNASLYNQLTWMVWLLFSIFLLFVHIFASSDLHCAV